jgi:UDP-2-acetamido-2,6-beta-L-arabino-hexul-4-ose reductase
MRVLITGSKGFIGKNLTIRLSELQGFEVIHFDRSDAPETLRAKVNDADAVVHLAGVNRPKDISEFFAGNSDLTALLCECILATGRPIALLLASSIQAELDNPYGRSKLSAEAIVEKFNSATGNPVVIYRLPNVFGKWCKPNYNSAVATFSFNIANDLPVHINDPSTLLSLVYIDDVTETIIKNLQNLQPGLARSSVSPVYGIDLGSLVTQIEAFKNCRESLVSERVGTGLVRALYATYVSFLPPKKFAYSVTRHGDDRGVFVEMLKTVDSGQFSFFTARPGITRGGHYHHTKTEKFLVIRGKARFGFKHILTNQTFELVTDGEMSMVVETVPGWTHDITNIGQDEMIVMLWANENFDRDKPDTIAMKVKP